MSLFKRKGPKLEVKDIDAFLQDREILEITGSGDPHEEYGKVRLFLENIKNYNSDLVLFDGDYLAEPAYMKKGSDISEVKKDSIQKLKTLYEVLLDTNAPTHFVAGNYEIPGTSYDATELLSSDLLFDLGCDKSKEPRMDTIHETEEYMDLTTKRETWPGKVHEMKGYTFLGVEGSNPINQTFPGERTEDNLEWAMTQPLEELKVDPEYLMIVTHSPPFGMRDNLGRFGVPPHLWGASKGSTALRKLADSIKPFMIMVGHIHESFGLHVRATPKGAEESSEEDVEDFDFARRMKVIIGYDMEKTNLSITLNKGTLEYWNWSRVRIAQEGTRRIVDIEGEWLERKGTPKPFKKINRIIDYDNALESVLKQ